MHGTAIFDAASPGAPLQAKTVAPVGDVTE
jgi:hypothetical protein